jgi:Tol biopolymer transport system component
MQETEIATALHAAARTPGGARPARAVISDRTGSENLWTVNVDGTGLRQVTRETDFALSSPAWTPDGRHLVHATRVDARTALRIRDLETQGLAWIVAEMQRDDQEGYAPNNILPGSAFTPD